MLASVVVSFEDNFSPYLIFRGVPFIFFPALLPYPAENVYNTSNNLYIARLWTPMKMLSDVFLFAYDPMDKNAICTIKVVIFKDTAITLINLFLANLAGVNDKRDPSVTIWYFYYS